MSCWRRYGASHRSARTRRSTCISTGCAGSWARARRSRDSCTPCGGSGSGSRSRPEVRAGPGQPGRRRRGRRWPFLHPDRGGARPLPRASGPSPRPSTRPRPCAAVLAVTTDPAAVERAIAAADGDRADRVGRARARPGTARRSAGPPTSRPSRRSGPARRAGRRPWGLIVPVPGGLSYLQPVDLPDAPDGATAAPPWSRSSSPTPS